MANSLILRLLHILRPAGNFCAAALLLLCSALPSGGQPQNELSAHGGGGLSTLLYTLPYGQRTVGFGYDAGLGYTRFLDASMVGKILGERFMDTQIGVVTGLSLSRYSAAAQLDGAAFALPDQIDVDGNPYDLHVELLRYRERQRATFVSIPLMVTYQHGRGKKLLYAQAGLKLSIPVVARYEVRNAAIRNEGYYYRLNYTVKDVLYKGFGEFTGRSSAGALPLRVVCAAAVEGGIRWQLSNSFALYAGLFADCGLNSALRPSGGESLMHPNVDSPENFTTGSALASRYTDNDRTVDKLSLASVGLKVHISFGLQQLDDNTSAYLRMQNWELQRFEDLLQLEMQMRRGEAIMQRKKMKAEAQQQQQVQLQKLNEELQRNVAKIRLRQQQQQDEMHVGMKNIIEQPIGDYSSSQTDPTPDQKTDMDRKVVLLKQNPSFRVICVGHTCDLGREEVNERISRARAEKAKNYLVQQGIEESRISVLGEGSRYPLVPNTSEKNRRINRRVEILIAEE
jgi:outer membrane protein OmpA-like peptidoglycan-associated protein